MLVFPDSWPRCEKPLLSLSPKIALIVQQHTKSLESVIENLGRELSDYSGTLLQQVRLHDRELSSTMVNRHLCRRGSAQFNLA